MDIQRIKDALKNEKYSFLKADEHLGSRIIILTVAGSCAYGTSISTSDIDLRGVTVELKRDILGLSRFEQFQDDSTDTVIFGLKKFIKLCLKSNPAMLEILGASEEFCIDISPEGQLLRDNIQLFLSKNVIATFGNYAMSQFTKVQEAMAEGDSLMNQKLGKQAMHVVRALMTAKDILEGKGVNLYRSQEHQMLLAIRQGYYTVTEYNELVRKVRSAFDYAARHTELPEKPSCTKVEELLIDIYTSKLCCT